MAYTRYSGWGIPLASIAAFTSHELPPVIDAQSIGYNARILIADPWRVVIAETQAALEPVSWMINDYGTSAMTVARTDALFDERFLRYGNWVYVEFDNGLPPWAGYINKRDGDGRKFTSAGVTVPLVSAEHYLSRLLTGKDRRFVDSAAGNVIASVIGEANAVYGESIVIGEMWGGGVPIQAEYHFNSLWEVIVEDVLGRVDAEFWIAPKLQNGRIELTAHFRQRRGERRPNVALIQGHNMTEEVFEEVGELVNQWALAGDDVGGQGEGWGSTRLDEQAAGVNVASMATYGVWGRGEVLNGVRTQGELAQIARERVARTGEIVDFVCCSAVDKSPAAFADYDVGDSVRAMAEVATFGPYDQMVRVLGREFDFADGICQLAIGRDYDV